MDYKRKIKAMLNTAARDKGPEGQRAYRMAVSLAKKKGLNIEKIKNNNTGINTKIYSGVTDDDAMYLAAAIGEAYDICCIVEERGGGTIMSAVGYSDDIDKFYNALGCTLALYKNAKDIKLGRISISRMIYGGDGSKAEAHAFLLGFASGVKTKLINLGSIYVMDDPGPSSSASCPCSCSSSSSTPSTNVPAKTLQPDVVKEVRKSTSYNKVLGEDKESHDATRDHSWATQEGYMYGYSLNLNYELENNYKEKTDGKTSNDDITVRNPLSPTWLG